MRSASGSNTNNTVDNSQQIDIQFELAKFRSFVGAKTIAGEVIKVGPDIIKFSPTIKSTRKIKIGFLALVHGNETIGLPILNTILHGLLNSTIDAAYEIYFGLGNLPAVAENKRFIQKDLNRCFGRSDVETAEDLRAREIELYLLNEVDYLIDLHQTVHGAASPFFIFQYTSKNCFNHLSLMNTKLPTILQFDAIGDSQNLSTDEYLRSRGRFGVALELGQIGYSDEKFQTGFNVCTQLIEKLNFFESYHDLNQPFTGRVDFPLFEISERLLATDDESRLNAHWANFSTFTVGQIMGQSKSGPILAPFTGSVLFPKLNQAVAKGQSLCFICTEIKPERKLDISTEVAPVT